MIEELPRLTPNPARRDRTIARCHQRLARRRMRAEATARLRATSYLVERALVAGVSLVYLIAMAGDLLNLYW